MCAFNICKYCTILYLRTLQNDILFIFWWFQWWFGCVFVFDFVLKFKTNEFISSFFSVWFLSCYIWLLLFFLLLSFWKNACLHLQFLDLLNPHTLHTENVCILFGIFNCILDPFECFYYFRFVQFLYVSNDGKIRLHCLFPRFNCSNIAFRHWRCVYYYKIREANKIHRESYTANRTQRARTC